MYVRYKIFAGINEYVNGQEIERVPIGMNDFSDSPRMATNLIE